MTVYKNTLIYITLFTFIILVTAGCATTEEIVEEPVEEPVVEEYVDDFDEEELPESWAQEPEPEVEVAELQSIHFEFDRSEITTSGARKLAENIEQLLELPSEYRIQIQAFTDHVGGDQYNLRLSQRRANSVARFYEENGFSINRIDARGLGKDPNPCAVWDPEGRGCLENRRADSNIVEPYRRADGE